MAAAHQEASGLSKTVEDFQVLLSPSLAVAFVQSNYSHSDNVTRTQA
jgi:hypothetical protein